MRVPFQTVPAISIGVQPHLFVLLAVIIWFHILQTSTAALSQHEKGPWIQGPFIVFEFSPAGTKTGFPFQNGSFAASGNQIGFSKRYSTQNDLLLHDERASFGGICASLAAKTMRTVMASEGLPCSLYESDSTFCSHTRHLTHAIESPAPRRKPPEKPQLWQCFPPNKPHA